MYPSLLSTCCRQTWGSLCASSRRRRTTSPPTAARRSAACRRGWGGCSGGPARPGADRASADHPHVNPAGRRPDSVRTCACARARARARARAQAHVRTLSGRLPAGFTCGWSALARSAPGLAGPPEHPPQPLRHAAERRAAVGGDVVLLRLLLAHKLPQVCRQHVLSNDGYISTLNVDNRAASVCCCGSGRGDFDDVSVIDAPEAHGGAPHASLRVTQRRMGCRCRRVAGRQLCRLHIKARSLEHGIGVFLVLQVGNQALRQDARDPPLRQVVRQGCLAHKARAQVEARVSMQVSIACQEAIPVNRVKVCPLHRCCRADGKSTSQGRLPDRCLSKGARNVHGQAAATPPAQRIAP
mmetsp:Transcript_34571/g.108581  ORF Transcript_34571/g.108581 Transcript_34571/m.108581 type:complete len:355 (+) Transcript_34571:686-1750(+)